MELIKPTYEFVKPKRGDLLWLSTVDTDSDAEPNFTPYYFDFISIIGNLCFQKIIYNDKGQRFAFDFGKKKSAVEQTHLIIKPDEVKHLRMCRSAEEAYSIEMSYFANKMAQLNAAMLREMIPSVAVPVANSTTPILPTQPVATAVVPVHDGVVSIRSEVLKKAVYQLLNREPVANNPLRASEVVAGITESKLAQIPGIGKGKITDLRLRLERHGYKLPA